MPLTWQCVGARVKTRALSARPLIRNLYSHAIVKTGWGLPVDPTKGLHEARLDRAAASVSWSPQTDSAAAWAAE
jgi:hypothetical protein